MTITPFVQFCTQLEPCGTVLESGAGPIRKVERWALRERQKIVILKDTEQQVRDYAAKKGYEVTE